jgi:murein DD-endopeptidase MepM/ murein hydrolase activator NlpD
VCAFGAAAVVPLTPDISDLPVRSVAEEIRLPDLSEQIASLETEKHYFMREERVRLGDTLGTLLARLGVDDAAAAAFIKSDSTAKAILQLKAGKLMQAKTDDSGVLYWLSTAVSEGREGPARDIVVTRTENGFTASTVGAELERRIEMRAGYINSSLFAATDAAQIPDTVTGKFVDMFSTNVDFRSDLRRGDHFNLVYETFWQNGSYVRAGRILAAEFVNGGKTYQAIWFEDAKSEQGGGYYSFDGKSLKRAFLKSPLEFTRISSGFSMRVHPLTGAWKQHKGIDFAAPTGTPIRAAADGTIEFVGNRGGYGNFIIVKHWKPYSTAYGHMSRFASGIRTGSKVRQGDVIGYVGTTGWSTGPHLHYEFRVNNAQQNPLNIDMPNARPLAAGELQQFRAAAADMEHRFSLLNPGIEKVAMK